MTDKDKDKKIAALEKQVGTLEKQVQTLHKQLVQAVRGMSALEKKLNRVYHDHNNLATQTRAALYKINKGSQ